MFPIEVYAIRYTLLTLAGLNVLSAYMRQKPLIEKPTRRP